MAADRLARADFGFARFPGSVDTLRRQGHEIGNHYIGAGTALLASDQRFRDALLRTERILGLEDGLPRGLERRRMTVGELLEASEPTGE